MAIEFKLNLPRLYRGSVAALSDPAALAVVQCRGHDAAHDEALFARLARYAAPLDLGDVGWGREPDLPAAFVHELTGPPTLASWIVALTVALQRSARDPVWRGQVLGERKGFMTLLIPYRRPGVVRGALQHALRSVAVCSAVADERSEECERLAAEIRTWRDTARQGGLSPLGLRFFAAACRRGMPVTTEAGILRIGWGKNAERMDGSFTGRTPTIATRLARHKWSAREHLWRARLPVAPAVLAADREHARRAAEELGWPVVVKPANRDRGIGVVAGIADEASLLSAFDAAAVHSPGAVLVEKHVEGDDHRMLVVGGRLIAVARRVPGGVRGDGERTIAQLLEEVNADPRRGTDGRSLMMRLALDDEALRCLAERGLEPSSVPPAGEFVPLRNTANISAGGTAENVADVHPDNRRLAERAAQVLGLDIAGVDFLTPDIARSWREGGGVVCEVNAQPGFRPHWLAEPHRDINGEIIDWLFRGKRPRIPTAAITGTNGKTTVSRMLHHIWLESGVCAGVCTTQGVWIGREAVSDDNLSGEPGARTLLADPAVEAAVIEMPRKALLRFGHPCDRYDVAALLNVQDDHIGVDGIDSLEAMAVLKAQVLEKARQAVVLNADDPLCLALRERLRPVRQVLVARSADNPAVAEHLQRAGRAVFVERRSGSDWIVLADGAARWPLVRLSAVPAAMNGLLRCNETNAMFAAALAWVHGVPQEQIRRGLCTFRNDLESNPGRYNWIEGFPFQVLLDFGHNPAGVRELLEVVRQVPVTGRRVLVWSIGNRHRRHFDDVAAEVAAEFDRIYVAQEDDYLRRYAEGYGDDPLGELLDAARTVIGLLLPTPDALELRRTRADAMRDALDAARPGDLLVLLARPPEALAALDSYRSRRAPEPPPPESPDPLSAAIGGAT